LLLVGFVALAMRFGLEAILGAFLAGALVSAGLRRVVAGDDLPRH
jgi:Kef-type K+ transport system membrane component KefB